MVEIIHLISKAACKWKLRAVLRPESLLCLYEGSYPGGENSAMYSITEEATRETS